jgi:hypothetical protein
LVLSTAVPRTEDLPVIQAAMQRFAACAERWVWKVALLRVEQLELQVLRGMPPGSLAALKHLAVVLVMAPADAASALGSQVSAAPNITTLTMFGALGGSPTEALAVVMQPLRRAAHLCTLWLSDPMPLPAARQAALLEGVVRFLAQPGAEASEEYCYALRHVLLAGAQPDALAACRAALARDGIFVSVDMCWW